MNKVLIIHSTERCGDDEMPFVQMNKMVLEEIAQSRRLTGVIVDAIEDNLQDLEKSIPRGYGLYLIHPSDVSNEDLENLRREQPQSWIYALGRDPRTLHTLSPEFAEHSDGAIFSIKKEYIEEILRLLSTTKQEPQKTR